MGQTTTDTLSSDVWPVVRAAPYFVAHLDHVCAAVLLPWIYPRNHLPMFRPTNFE